MVGCGIFGLLKSFVTKYTLYVICEFFESAIGSGINVSLFILSMELIGPKQRVLGGTLISTCFSIGGVIVGTVAMVTQDYRQMIRILYTPALLVLFYYWLIPESIRWLMVSGRQQKAVDVLLGAAKLNNVKYSDETLQKLYEQCNNLEMKSDTDDDRKLNGQKREQSPIWEVLKSKIMLLRILNCSFCWLTNTFVFYGLSLNSVSLAGDKYTNFIVTCLAEIPGYITVYIILNRYGRRWSLCGSLLLGGIACFGTEMLPEMAPASLRLGIYLLGKCAITISFSVLYVYTAEIYPTNIRNRLMSTCSMIGRIGSMLAPQTPLLVRYNGIVFFLKRLKF